jgi:hypothetical protein
LDEFAVESHKDCAEEVGKVMVEAYHEASVAGCGNFLVSGIGSITSVSNILSYE